MPSPDELHDPPSLGWGLFLKRLIGERKKDVAAEYYPLPDGAEKNPKWTDARIEAHYKQAVTNLDRQLGDRDDHPPTCKLLDVIAKVCGPEAAVAIAHFTADRYGTERGAVKLNPKRVQDDLAVVKREVHQLAGALNGILKHLEKIDDDVAASKESKR